MINRNNPTSNSRLSQRKTGVSTVKPSFTELRDLEILCNNCTKFDKDGYFIHKVLMKHDTRNELYACQECPRIVSEYQVKHVMRLELPEYHNYEKSPTKDNILRVNKDRQDSEKFVIKAINAESPTELMKRTGAKVVKNKRDSGTTQRKFI